VDINAIRTLFAARYVGFCDAATAERLAHAVPAHFVASSLRGML
jgi:Ala-tRNA(Pro) deacylase